VFRRILTQAFVYLEKQEVQLLFQRLNSSFELFSTLNGYTNLAVKYIYMYIFTILKRTKERCIEIKLFVSN